MTEMDFSLAEYEREPRAFAVLAPEPDTKDAAPTAHDIASFLTREAVAARIRLAGQLSRGEIARADYLRQDVLWSAAKRLAEDAARLRALLDSLRVQIEEVAR